jgi:hypothetical protein
MTFESPIWLLGLLPWLAVMVYLLRGRGRSAAVPFLQFWQGSNRLARRRAWRRPPVFVQLMLLSMLLAVLAAAGPVYRGLVSVNGDVSIVLDCGASMARPGQNGEAFRGVLDRCAGTLGLIGGNVSITAEPGQTIVVPGSAWVSAAKAMHPTAIRVDLHQAIAERLRQTRDLVVVLSDQKLDLNEARVLQIFPDQPMAAVAITLLAARPDPHPQVMVRLENHSDLKSLQIHLQSDQIHLDRNIILGPAGKSQDEFFDLPSLGQIVSVNLNPTPADDPWAKAFLVRQSNGEHLALVGEVPGSVRRMVEIYSKDRPAGADAQQVVVTNHPLGEQQAGIWIDSTSEGGKLGEATVTAHPITRNMKRWPIPVTPAPPPAGFSPLVVAGERTIVAERDTSVRQVWIHANFRDWEKTSDFVIFFGNALDWIAAERQGYSAIRPTMLGSDWRALPEPGERPVPPGAWPGVYKSQPGGLIAVNAGAYPEQSQRVQPVPGAVAGLKIPEKPSLASSVLYSALVSLLAAAIIWPGSRVALK